MYLPNNQYYYQASNAMFSYVIIILIYLLITCATTLYLLFNLDLPHAVKHVGMSCDDDVLTIAGGLQSVDGQWKYSNQVYQLNVGGDGGWVKLSPLPHIVSNPMLVCDDSYLYVLGGVVCKQCVKLDKNNQHQWTTFTDLPVHCSNVRGGVLVVNNTVLVTFTTHDLEHSDKHMDHTGVQGQNITHCTPVWYRDKVTASVLRGDGARTVECYNSTTNTWTMLYRTRASAGAGRFLSVRY